MYKIKGKDYSAIDVPENQEKTVVSFLQDLNSGKIVNNKMINRNKSCQNESVQTWILTENLSNVNNNLENYKGCKWGGYVGRVRDRERNIEMTISSRLDSGDKCYFLSRMIKSYVNINLDLELDDEDVPSNEDQILDFLVICLFRNQLIQASNSGWLKKYEYYKKNDDRLKGKINVGMHLRMNGNFDNGKIAYEYREHTVDNAVNHLVLRTWIELKKAYPTLCESILSRTDESGQSAEKILNQLKFLAPNYEQQSLQLVVKKAEIPITNELFFSYDLLRLTCIEILNDLNLSIFDGEKEEAKVQGLVFYIPDLWEVYIQDKLNQYGIINNDIRCNVQYNVDLLTKGETKLWKAIPDFVLENSTKKIILDAKCKPGWRELEAKSNNIRDYIRSDVIQVLAYGELFEASSLGIIYPFVAKQSSDSSEIDVWKIGVRDTNSEYLRCGLCIPRNGEEDFDSWNKKMIEEEERLFYNLKDKVTENMKIL